MKKRDFKELVFFSLFLALGVGLSVAKSMGILIPNFFDLIFRIYEPLDDFINRL